MGYNQTQTPSGGSSLLNNYIATSAPTATDDSSAGYAVGSVWIDVSADERYVCLDATATSAVWAKSTAGTATEIVNTPAGNISATNVQTALNELDTEKQATGNYFVKGTDDADDVPDGTTNKAYTATEKTKLAGIETGADVTDATNVDSAGATMNSDTNVSGNSWVLDEDTMSSDSNTKVPTQQSVKAYVDTQIAGVGGGAWTLVSYQTGSAVGSINFTGLDLSTHKSYKVIVKYGQSGSSAYMQMTVNGVASGYLWVAVGRQSGGSAIDTQNTSDGKWNLSGNESNPAFQGEYLVQRIAYNTTPNYIIALSGVGTNITSNEAKMVTIAGSLATDTNVTSLKLERSGGTGSWEAWILRPNTS